MSSAPAVTMTLLEATSAVTLASATISWTATLSEAELPLPIGKTRVSLPGFSVSKSLTIAAIRVCCSVVAVAISTRSSREP